MLLARVERSPPGARPCRGGAGGGRRVRGRQPAALALVHRHHAHRGRPRGSRLGARLPEGCSHRRAEADRLDPRLVRRLSRIRVLHGGPVVARRDDRRGPRHWRGRLRLSRGGLRGRGGGDGDHATDGPSRQPVLGHSAGCRRDLRRGQAVHRRPGGQPGSGRAAAARRSGLVGVVRPEGATPLAGGSGRHRGHRRAARSPHALRRSSEAGDDRGRGGAAGGCLGDGASRWGLRRESGAGLGGHPAVPVRPLVQHLRRQPHVDDGGRVRLLAGPGRRGPVHRRCGTGHARGQSPGPGRRAAGPHRADAPVLRLLRAGRGRRAAARSAVARRRVAQPALLDRLHRSARRGSQRVVGVSVLVEPGPAQRHGLGKGAPLPVLAVVAELLRLQLPDERSAAAAVHRPGAGGSGAAVLQAGPARHGAGGGRGDRRGRLRDPARGTPLECPDPALLLPHRVPDRGSRHRRGDPHGTRGHRPAAGGAG